MEISELVESRMKSYAAEGDKLAADWADMLGKIDEARAKKGETPLDSMTRRNLAICFENASMDTMLKSKGGMLNEAGTTDSSAISYLGVQLPIISAMLPSSVLQKIATVQALDRRTGSVFYLNALAGTTKDGLTADTTTLLDAKLGHARSIQARNYGSQAGTQTVGSLYTAVVSATLTNRPILPGSVQIVVGNEIFVDNGKAGDTSASLISNASGSAAGTINYSTGVITAQGSYGDAVVKTAPVCVYAYKYQAPTAPTATGVIVPAIDFSMASTTVTAIDFTLQAKFTMAALMDLKKAHGMDLESEVVRILGGELKFSQDHYGIDKMYNAAIDIANGAGAADTFTATPGSGQEFVWRKFQFHDAIEQSSNLIFAKTLRGQASFIVCGNNVARLIKQMKPDFSPISNLAKLQPVGPFEIGELNGRPVIQDPFLPTNRYFTGYKGESFLQSSFVYAPYIPMFSTQTLTTSDLVSQKGFMAAGGFLVVNPGLFSYGDIVI